MIKVIFLVILGLVLGSQATTQCGSECDKFYDLIIVGGGFAGISTTFYADLAQQLALQTGTTLTKKLNLSNVLLLETRDALGGIARAIEVPKKGLNQYWVNQNKKLYNYDGPFLFDLGPQRVPHLTCKLDRVTAIASETLIEQTPYYTYFDSRERKVTCDVPDFNQYSPGNPYGLVRDCAVDFPFYGDSSKPWDYDNWIGPAYNLTDLQDWAYKNQNAIGAIYDYLLYDGPNPVTCTNGSKTCVECGDCYMDSCKNYANLKAALLGQLGYGTTEFFIFDFTGFYTDFEANTVNPCQWAVPYNYREFSTDAINGYVVGSTIKYVSNLAKPIKAKGTVLTGRTVSYVNTAGGGNSVVVRTVDGSEFRGSFVILAVPPSVLASGGIKGNVVPQLQSAEGFNSVFCVNVTTVTVVLNYAFWETIVPKPSGNITQWVLLRSYGDEGHIPRSEIRYSIYGAAMIAFRASYTDYRLKQVLNKMGTAIDEGLFKFGPKLWRALRNDLSYIYSVDNIPEDYIQIHIENFVDGWCYTNSSTTLTADQIKNYAVAPLGLNIPVCLAHQAWDVEFLGWKEAGLQTGLRCLDRLQPKSAALVHCLEEATFPPCDPVDSCYNDPSVHISGSETIIPSKYCSERWWYNNYVKTPNCINHPTLNNSTCSLLLNKINKIN